MPDIAMCTNDTCPRCRVCMRFIATPDPHWQSYFNPLPKWDKCPYFWDIQDYKWDIQEYRKEK